MKKCCLTSFFLPFLAKSGYLGLFNPFCPKSDYLQGMETVKVMCVSEIT